MANNTTTYSSSLPSEVERLPFQCLKPLDITVTMMNVISFLINIFHLSVITRLESLKGMQYRTILINISLADMTNTLIVGVFHSCYDFFFYNFAAGEPVLKIPINVMMASANYIGYYVFLVASVQKYLAICRPISYQSSSLIKRLPIAFVVAWMYVFVVTFSLAVTEDLFSWSEMEGFRIDRMVLLSIPPNLITGVLLAKVYRAMKAQKRVRKAMDATRVNREERKGAMYLIIIFTLEMIVFTLNLICFVIFYHTRTPFVGKIWNGFIKAPYTISNTIIYGWRNEPYRRHVRRMFGCRTSSIETIEMS
mgnify:CR=1 FL=1